MKTISDYTLYCTEAQTRKALELGAPIMTFGYPDLEDAKEEILKMNRQAELYQTENGGIMVGQIPTAEQMIGWLEDKQGISLSILYGYDVCEKWAFDLDSKEYIDYKSGVFDTRSY